VCWDKFRGDSTNVTLEIVAPGQAKIGAAGGIVGTVLPKVGIVVTAVEQLALSQVTVLQKPFASNPSKM